jgi:hypothetical protein
MAYQRELWRIVSGSEVRFMCNITPPKDMLYQIYIPQTTADYHLLIVTLLASLLICRVSRSG